MIKKHSDDPDVEAAALQAVNIVREVLGNLAPAEKFDYGGHELSLGEYDVCSDCTAPIAEAQQASQKLTEKAGTLADELVKEHVELAAELLRMEANAAQIRAQLHNGHGSEPIVNDVLGFIHDRHIHDRYEHSHEAGGK